MSKQKRKPTGFGREETPPKEFHGPGATIRRGGSTSVKTTNINITQTRRPTMELKVWKDALDAFNSLTNPNRVKMYDLLDIIELDEQIEATWGKRRDAILNKQLLFNRNGKEDEELQRLLNCPDMRELIKVIHESIAYGYSLVQVNDIYFDDELEHYRIMFDLINRKHVHPEKELECISKDQNQVTKDFFYKQPPLSRYMIWAGDATDKGLLFKAAKYVIIKNGDISDWSEFAEVFGMPLADITYDDYDYETINKLESLIQNRGGKATIMRPKNSDLNLLAAPANASGDIYEKLAQFCNFAISKCIVGNTLTTEQGSVGSEALGNIHAEVERQKMLSDQKLVLSVLNTQFKAMLNRFGFNAQGGEIWFESEAKDWDALKTKYEVLSGIARTVPVSDDLFYEEFDIPKPDNYEELKKEMAARQHFPEPEPDPDPTKAKAALYDFFAKPLYK